MYSVCPDNLFTKFSPSPPETIDSGGNDDETTIHLANITHSANERSEVDIDIDTKTIWSKYAIDKSPADGHCFMHSVIKSHSSQLLNFPHENIDSLLEKLKNETYNNASRYVEFIDGDGLTALHSGVTEYIYNKKYDTSYGDLIPNIIANAIMKNIIIVMKTKGNTRIELISCLEANQPSILVYKNGAHYDAIIPIGSHTNLS